MPLRGALIAGAVGGARAAAPAGAATVATDAPCYTSGAAMGVAGQGFGAGAPVSVEASGLFGSTPADAVGAFQLITRAPLLGTTAPAVRTFALTASDETTSAQTGFRVTNFAAAHTPSAPPRPSTVIRWRVAGFAPGARVYAHYVHGGRQQARAGLGRMPRTCGVLRKRLALIPISSPASGRWRIQLDTHKRYSARTRAKLVETGNVTRRIG
jgi:hypothetical protein